MWVMCCGWACVGVGVGVYSLRIVTTDKILYFINSLIIIMIVEEMRKLQKVHITQ